MLEFKTDIVIFNRNVKIAEFSLKEYKTLLKSLLSITHTPENFINALQELFCYKTNISKQDIQQFNFIDFFILLMHFKCTSSSHVIEIQTEIDSKKTNINLNLLDFTDYLNALNVSQMLIEECIDDDFTVTYRLPTITEVLALEQQDLIYNFIKSIDVKNKLSLSFLDLPIQEKKSVYDSLPLKIAITIKKRVDSIISYFNNIDLLTCIPELLGEVNLFFNFNKTNLITIIKLIFGEDLRMIYENQFLLAKYGNVSAEYLDTCTLGEYNIFVNLLNKDINSKKETGGSNMDVGRQSDQPDIN